MEIIDSNLKKFSSHINLKKLLTIVKWYMEDGGRESLIFINSVLRGA
jgi:hypothetical protein